MKYIITTIIIFFLIYAMGAFISLEINRLEWTIDGRAAYLWFSIIGSCLVNWIIYCFNINFTDKKQLK